LLIRACRSIALTSWNILIWCKKLAFFLLPPLLYNGIKLLLPRVLQQSVRQQLGEALNLRRTAAAPAITAAPLPAAPSSPAARIELRLPPDEIELRLPPDEFDRQIEKYRALHHLPESNASLLDAKFAAAEALYREQHCDRVRLLRELARLASIRGQHLLACAFGVRALRLLGRDHYHDLPELSHTLQSHGLSAEAEALNTMYDSSVHTQERTQRLLENVLDANRRPPPTIQFECFEDCRHAEIPRVAVIVSLYNAAAKLPLFLHAIRNQTLLKDKQVEVILLDSGSPAPEYAALTSTLQEFSLPYVYARTPVRETIQTAWNRGIALARAPYLSFLGVDEAVTPEALAVLAQALDANPSLDWVQGDSLLTEVNQQGIWQRDIMTYDRAGYTANHVYLETCFLSWVGAMYRRSIHDRFGYYDGSFRATGDNEFKLRILPFIKTLRIPHLLGLFINYPEPRATASPIAELEDIRAWYLHRTSGGVRYALDRRDPCEAEKLLLLALCYRKSYTNHKSSDVEYAAQVGTYLKDRLPGSPLVSLVPGVDRLLRAVRVYDHPEPLTPAGMRAALKQARATWEIIGAEHMRTPWLGEVEYDFVRDNRHEQHAFLYT
jgi:glycosyltransferase involved in cell wall biosynthesis